MPSVPRLFICHADPDSALGDQIKESLDNLELDIIIDTKNFTSGDDLFSFINESIESSSIYVILYSSHTQNAKTQKAEISAIWRQSLKSTGKRIITIRKGSVDLPPLLDVKGTIRLKDDLSDYDATLEKLLRALKIEPKNSKHLLQQALNAFNPFRYLRAEDFEDHPEVLAHVYAPHIALQLSRFHHPHPALVEGSRGSGKSMLLLSIRARNLARQTQRGFGINEIFGCYLRMGEDTFAQMARNTITHELEPGEVTDERTIEVFRQELFISMLEELIEELHNCIMSSFLKLSNDDERHLVADISSLLAISDQTPSTNLYDFLINQIWPAKRKISDFATRLFTFHESLDYPMPFLRIETLARVLQAIKKYIPLLKETTFAFLFDEMENLRVFQRAVVNTVIKQCRPSFTIKAAQKPTTQILSSTLLNQELQETHDYHHIKIEYEIEGSELAQYCTLLSSIVDRIMASEDGYIGLDKMLPKRKGNELNEQLILDEIAMMLGMQKNEFQALPANESNSKINHLHEAAIYRILSKKSGSSGRKHFSGLSELAILSGGIVRYFLEMMGMAYHLWQESATDSAERKIIIDPEHQSTAAYVISAHAMHYITHNVIGDGPRLKYFVADLAYLLRYRLLRTNSEPEACKFLLLDPEKRHESRFIELRRILELCVREGILHSPLLKMDRRPKHTTTAQPEELGICRIFAPALGFSPRSRWVQSIKCEELSAIWDLETRHKAMSKIITNKYEGGRRTRHIVGKLFDSDARL